MTKLLLSVQTCKYMTPKYNRLEHKYNIKIINYQ
jgi:hypothetical protein